MKKFQIVTEDVLAIVCNANTISCPCCKSLLIDNDINYFIRLSSGGGKRLCLCKNCLQKIMLIRNSVQKKDAVYYSPMLDTTFRPVFVN